MPDYKKMYLALIKGTEDAIQRLEKAQHEAEEIYLLDSKPANIICINSKDEKAKDSE